MRLRLRSGSLGAFPAPLVAAFASVLVLAGGCAPFSDDFGASTASLRGAAAGVSTDAPQERAGAGSPSRAAESLDPGAAPRTPIAMPQTPPALVPAVLAPESIYGYYVPTQRYRYFEFPYVLRLRRDRGDDRWVLATGERVLGSGPFTDDTARAGAFVVREFAAQDPESPGAPSADIRAQQRFPASRALNRLTLHSPPAAESEGQTALGRLLEKRGALHWIRITDDSEALRPTALVYGPFTPLDPDGVPDMRHQWHVWPDGQWRWWTFPSAEAKAAAKRRGEAAPAPFAIGGTWEARDGVLFIRRVRAVGELAGAHPPGSSAGADPTTDQVGRFTAVFDAERHLLWLTTPAAATGASEPTPDDAPGSPGSADPAAGAARLPFAAPPGKTTRFIPATH